jgi:hypothetical protein
MDDTPVAAARAAADDAPQIAQRPRLVWRVGITGARSLEAGQFTRLRQALHEVLTHISGEVRSLSKQEDVSAFYDLSGDRGPALLLRCLSPLARGADRLGAEVALQVGYELYVPMPFPADEYRNDFGGRESPLEVPLGAAEDMAEFEGLLGRAGDAWLALDGDRDHQLMAYEAVGRFVARHSDVLIAIWDGAPAAGRGGTGDVVRYALAHGVPVWWIHATENRGPRWLSNLAGANGPSRSLDPRSSLRNYVASHIRPPMKLKRHAHGVIQQLARVGRGSYTEPAAGFFAEKASRPGAWARAYEAVIHLAARRRSQISSGPSIGPSLGPAEPVTHYWSMLYGPANRLAQDYAARYRSSYVWLFVLGMATLIFGASAAVAHGHVGWVLLCVALEACSLLMISLIVRAAVGGDWHERSIEYRLLAELCRKQQVLAPLGRAISFRSVRHVLLRGLETEQSVSGAGVEGTAENIDRSDARAAWVAWLFDAWDRAAVLPRGNLSVALPEIVEAQILKGLIAEQLDYHRARKVTSERAEETLLRFGQWSFLIVCVSVAFKLCGLVASVIWPRLGEFPAWEGALLLLSWLAIVLPAVSAASLGIRSYAELQLLAEQSVQMIEALFRAKSRIETVDLREALAAQTVGAEVQALATLMLRDIEGWSRLFADKAIEP